MPADVVSFQLKPIGFFDRNPALDVAPTRSDHCVPGHHDHHHHDHHDHHHGSATPPGSGADIADEPVRSA
jgi:primary-amine oxidase